ncbi:RNA polymerase sigma factor SigJ [Nocardia rhizosphaerae]|uniref:RNA polymerase sigma factor SigJ n=1 Tax=Nocardia rhizosphaerae TaxID=1691571 RepID=A0ABV8LDC7_9NOCA
MRPATDSPQYRHLFGVAYRILGSVHDAEDAIGEALARWQSLDTADRDLIREPLAWLTRVVSRICLDQLGSARARRESYAGIWLPEPVPGTIGPAGPTNRPTDPADAVTLDESVSLALLRAMESLAPAERVALILHDVFGLDYTEIGSIVGRTPQACRQLASVARRRVRDRPRFQPDDEERARAVLAFTAACTTGDLGALVEVLAPDIVVRSDGGGATGIARVPVTGLDRVARFLLGIASARSSEGRLTAVPAMVNNRTGLVIGLDGATIAVMDFAVAGGLIAEIAIVLNPDKLRAWHREDPP